MDPSQERSSVSWDMFTSSVLADNPLNDPATRQLPVILPPGYRADSGRRYPVLYGLTGYTGSGAGMLNFRPWNVTLAERLDRLFAAGMPHVIAVLPDCFTSYGGSQYLNSPAIGRYEDYLTQEIVPYVDQHYATVAAPAGRGVFGKSSGGYGALIMGMRHAALFGAIACHSGDMAFELCYQPDFPKTANGINAAGGLESWWQAFAAKPKKSRADVEVLMIVAMAACYSPNPAAPLGLDLPFTLDTCELRTDVWERWCDLDPIVMAERYADALRSLRLLFIDCGSRDEFHLHYGARRLVRRLHKLGVTHEHQEFDDGHMDIDYRYDVSLPKLASALVSS
ncbi:MAG TPA: alpha/beta hydrolase-fold protein [Roseiflexaceae bacterium]|nr:alpha/beta hydrolase-fold protein [Roseiflexaceae bacterium]